MSRLIIDAESGRSCTRTPRHIIDADELQNQKNAIRPRPVAAIIEAD